MSATCLWNAMERQNLPVLDFSRRATTPPYGGEDDSRAKNSIRRIKRWATEWIDSNSEASSQKGNCCRRRCALSLIEAGLPLAVFSPRKNRAKMQCVHHLVNMARVGEEVGAQNKAIQIDLGRLELLETPRGRYWTEPRDEFFKFAAGEGKMEIRDNMNAYFGNLLEDKVGVAAGSHNL